SVHRLKYYISNLRLVKEDGTFFDPAVVHYCDISEEETNRFQLDNVPAGTYRGISFTYGLDESLNVDDGLPRTQTNINMEWPIPGDQGYHYMKFEGKYDSLGTGVIKNFNLHTGATMGNQNYIDFNFDIPAISIDGNQWSIDLVMDLNEWLQNPHTWDFATYGPMIMMKQDAQEVLKANGKTVFTVASVVKD
ncbi:MAG: hypothetical protein OEQ53_14185, partial [Saprospiraceae bacterium]|nr:hypothetical protein [Saprospiraceae bacterium]